jgi:hypothetical protein
MTIHNTMTVQTSNAIKHYGKYGFLASPECWKRNKKRCFKFKVLAQT